ncbi:hypothetical protein GCK32_011701, partial [Trichostrongylus colubriformis]
MEPLKIEEETLLKCSLCGMRTPFKYEMVQHIYRHRTHRKKHQRSFCPESFYTIEGRQVFCLERGHIHLYGKEMSAFFEPLFSMLSRDVEYALRNGTEAAVMQRTEADLGCNFAENSTSSKTLPTDVHTGDALLGHDQLLLRFLCIHCIEFLCVSLKPRKSFLHPVIRKRLQKQVEIFPWSRLPQELQVKILQNLSRSDLDNCQLVDRRMSSLILSNEPLMKRRLI